MTFVTAFFVFSFVFASLVLLGAGFAGVFADIKQWRRASEAAVGHSPIGQEAVSSWRTHTLQDYR